MNDKKLFELFKWELGHYGHKLNDTDADEIISFVRELQPDYIVNFREFLKLYGVVMTDKEMPYRIPLMMWFIENLTVNGDRYVCIEYYAKKMEEGNLI